MPVVRKQIADNAKALFHVNDGHPCLGRTSMKAVILVSLTCNHKHYNIGG